MVKSAARSRSPHRDAPTPGGGAGATPADRSNSLTVAPCSLKAAKYATAHWHYSGCMPAGTTFRVGVWEDGRFIGVVVLSRGANNHLGGSVGLTDQRHCVELTRIALDTHRAPVTQIAAAALREFRRHNPGVRAVISYADPLQGHHGGIYQAGGWAYLGKSRAQREVDINGVTTHKRSVGAKYGTASVKRLREMGINAAPSALMWKHTYALGFDRQMRTRLRKMSRPYPPPHNHEEAAGS